MLSYEKDAEVSNRIRQFRRKRGMTLAQVADLTGLSVSMLSQVERGQTEPSLATLRLVATALGVHMAILLDSPNDPEIVTRQGSRRAVRLPGWQMEVEQLVYSRDRTFDMMIMSVQPGGATTAEQMSHVGEEAALVVEGHVRYEVGSDTYELGPGDSISINPSNSHRMVNIGTSVARVLIVESPPRL